MLSAKMQRAYEGDYVILWHGSPLYNKESILEKGIIPYDDNLENVFQYGLDFITKLYKLKAYQKHRVKKRCIRWSMRRLEEHRNTFFEQPVVFLSGDRKYAIRNSLASREYLHVMAETSERMLFKEELRRITIARVKYRKVQRQMEALDKKERDGSIRRSFFKRHMKLYKKYNELGDIYAMVAAPFRALRKDYSDIIQGKEYVLFKVKIPVYIFKTLLASSRTRDSVERFETVFGNKRNDKEARRWMSFSKSRFEMFREVHLTGVDPSFIIQIEEGIRKRW